MIADGRRNSEAGSEPNISFTTSISYKESPSFMRCVTHFAVQCHFRFLPAADGAGAFRRTRYNGNTRAPSRQDRIGAHVPKHRVVPRPDRARQHKTGAARAPAHLRGRGAFLLWPAAPRGD